MLETIDLGELAKSNAALKKRSSLADETADILRGMILLEKLPPGMALPERDMSSALGISRTPLREAIRLLEWEGLVEYSASRRPRVANPSLEEISKYLCVQGALEALGGELACSNASDKELQNIANLNQQMLETLGEEDPLVSFERDMAVHTAIVAAGHNEPLAETHATYNARLWRARFVSSQRKMSRDSTKREHQEIVDALLSRNPKKTAEALKSHLTTAISNIAKALKEQEQES